VEPINFKRASRHERTKQEEINAFACNKEAKLVINASIDLLGIPKLLEKETLRISNGGELFFFHQY